MASLTVHEWLIYIPIFVDFSQIDAFISWMEKEMKGEVFKTTLSEIKKAQPEAWISPDFTTTASVLGGKINGFDVEIRIEFRLRTLCLQIRCWKSPEAGVKLLEAFEDMKKAEEEFKNFIEQWGTTVPTCNVLVVRPFYDAENKTENWLMDHRRDLEFFPTNCDNGCCFTLSLSKLIEKDEKLPFLVTNIRDKKGILRKVIMLCSEKKTSEDDRPYSYSRVRWVFFTGLIQHVLDRINEGALSIGSEISELEEKVHTKLHEVSGEKNAQKLMETLGSVIEFSKALSSLENELAIISDDFLGVKMNMPFIELTAGRRGISKEPIKDRHICGNVEDVSSPKSLVKHGIFKGEVEEKEGIRCSWGYYCALCDTKNGTLDLTIKSPLEMSVTQEAMKLIEISNIAFRKKKSEIARCINRTKSFVSNLASILSMQTNLNLNLSLSRTAIDQKEILSKMEAILKESEKDRKVAEKATKAVEILSLLFASFVLGEISSNFIIWGLQQVWPTQVPPFAYIGGYLMALAISGIVFLLLYFGYLRRK